MAATRTGGCLCGAVRYESAGEPVFSLHCHCRDCQRSSGTAYIAAMRVPAERAQGALRLTLGRTTTAGDVSRATQAIVDSVRRLRRGRGGSGHDGGTG